MLLSQGAGPKPCRVVSLPLHAPSKPLLRSPCRALSREQKERVVATVLPCLEKSDFALALSHHRMTAKQMESLRRRLPPSSKFIACKNSLMKIAVARSPGWSGLVPAARGSTAWLFLAEDDVAPALRTLHEAAGELRQEDAAKQALRKAPARGPAARSLKGAAGLEPAGAPALAPAPAAEELLQQRGAVLQGQTLEPADVETLRNCPSRGELMAQLVAELRAVPSALVRVLESLPARLVHTLEGVLARRRAEEGGGAGEGGAI